MTYPLSADGIMSVNIPLRLDFESFRMDQHQDPRCGLLTHNICKQPVLDIPQMRDSYLFFFLPFFMTTLWICVSGVFLCILPARELRPYREGR